MKLKINKDFPFAHRGCDVVEYKAGTEVDTNDQELVDVATREKWATKARNTAPENKGLSGPGENKTEGGDSGSGDGAESTGTDGQPTGAADA